MNKFWKEVVGGQVNTGVYQAGPRHAQKQYGSFKTGRPPRLPFQFVTYFEINPKVTMANGKLASAVAYDYSSLVRAIDLPSVTFTVDKKNQYNKLKPIITTKDFKPFTMTVYDDIESRWYALWQNYYNYHFMDGRFDAGEPTDAIINEAVEQEDGTFKKATDEDGNVIPDVPAEANLDLGSRNTIGNRSKDLIANYALSGPDALCRDPNLNFNSDRNGADIHDIERRNFFDAIHVFQIHADTVTRTTAINPILTDAQVTQLDYASSGVPSEITFNIEYEKLAYGPVLNYKYDEDPILVDLIEDVTKAPVFDPAQDKLKGLVQGLFGLEQRNSTSSAIPLHDTERDLAGTEINANIQRSSSGTTSGGFFSNLIGNALNQKLNEASSDLFKKKNKNLQKFNFLG